MPIGVLQNSWVSSEVLNQVALIAIQEVLGFHAQMHPVIGANAASPIYALGGCRDFDSYSVSEKRCGNETTVHVNMDSWIGSYMSQVREFERDYPSLAPVDLGSMGYGGEEGLFVSRAALDAASGSSGLPLDFYRTYNFSGHNALQYFHTVEAVPSSELSLCSATDFSKSSLLASYVQFSGDADGVVTQGTTSIANCRDERWWPAPACRAQYPQCIPVLTTGNGLHLQAIMQQMTAYSFTAAVGVSSGWSSFYNHARTYRCLHYWWIPDNSFVDVNPAQLVLPRHRSTEWAAGNQKTMAAPSAVSKVVSRDLQAKAWTVQEFISNTRFQMQEVQDLLLERETGSTPYDVACKWIRENRDRWSAWKPVATSCPEGWGLVDSSGHSVSVRADAVACEPCPAGTAPAVTSDAEGKVSHCTPCQAGYFQRGTGATTCEPCSKGSTAAAGGTSCLPCAMGEYQPLDGQGTCLSCGQDRTTNVLGATSYTECECKVGLVCQATTSTTTIGQSTTLATSSMCLNDGVPASERRFLQSSDGRDLPVGVLQGTWVSSMTLNQIALIAIQEVLGFHAEMHPQSIPRDDFAIYALGGCRDWNSAQDRRCGNETTVHVNMGSLIGSYMSQVREFERDYPSLALVDLGSMGYVDEVGLFVSRAALDAASGSSGLPLEFYRTYNFSGHNALQYFHTVDAVPLSELSLCSATDFSKSSLLASYVQLSGDADGVVTQGTTSIANCRDERWWPAPACRAQYPQCIPVLTTGSGWGLQTIMQQMTAYSFTAAVGVSSSWSAFLNHTSTYRCLHYYWIPDATFVDVNPAQLVLPRHRYTEWIAGNQKTMAPPSAVSKVVSRDLQAKAWTVQEFISNTRFDMQEVQDLMFDLSGRPAHRMMWHASGFGRTGTGGAPGSPLQRVALNDGVWSILQATPYLSVLMQWLVSLVQPALHQYGPLMLLENSSGADPVNQGTSS